MEFARSEKTADELLDAYHEQCLGCHTQRAKSGQDTGPRTCGGCHVPGVSYVFARRPAGFGVALHKLHVDAYGEDKCDSCHVAKDENAVRLIYEMGADLKSLPLKDAAHAACVGCHLERSKEKEKTGPVSCAACHENYAEPDLYARPGNLPDEHRLFRDQQDNPVIYVGKDLARFGGVLFKHKMHETVVGSCRACHHRTLQACDTCHTVEGKAEGGNVKLAKAYHEPFSPRSCVGCHETRMQSKSCVGCHGGDLIPLGPSDGACQVCHGERPPVQEKVPAYPQTETAIGNKYSLAEKDLYAPAAFSHTRHITKLRERMKGDKSSRLAGRFHHDKPVLCATCHHHASKDRKDGKPPRCTTCHADRPDPEHLGLPSSPSAYHQRCVGCHERMDVTRDGKPLGCSDCHRKKTDSAKEAK